MEVHPVILAGGRGSRMYPLTDAYPKALLPVGNKPLIWYPMQLLERNGFEEVTVVVRSSQSKAISERLEKLEGSGDIRINFSITEVSDDEEVGSADALLSLRGKIKLDVLVLSCDLLTTVSIHQLWDIHQSKRCSLTALLCNVPPSTSEDHVRKSIGPPPEQDLIGLDDEGRLVFHSALVDIDENLQLGKGLLKRHSHFRMYSQLLDTHLYIISKLVLDNLHEKRSLSSVKGELVPHLVRHQDFKGDFLPEYDNLEQLALEHSSSFIPNTTHCHALLLKSGELCMRVNTVSLYIEANRIVPQHLVSFGLERHDSQSIAPSKGKGIGSDSLVGTCVQVADRASVKRSTIGHHCFIGDKTKIINSVLMDYVKVGEGCVLQGCVLCSNSRVGDRVTLKDCIIGADMVISSDGVHHGEMLSKVNELML